MSVLPIKIENGVATINVVKSIKLSKRQQRTLENMKVGNKYRYERYLQSLMGLIKDRVDVNRLNYGGLDPLASKPRHSVLAKFNHLLNNQHNVEHKPTQRNIGQWIGVEIECFIPQEYDDNGEPNDCTEHYHDLRSAIREAKITRVQVKQDGSLECDDNGVGVEVTFLFNTMDGFDKLRQLCDVLTSHGCYVNETCGLHVHLDARHLKRGGVLRIGRRLGRALPILQWMVDDSRHDNHYCKMSVGPLKNDRDDRYHAVNLTSFFDFKTVEVRLHGGSINSKKIQNWIETLRFLANKRIVKPLKTFQEFIDLGVPAHLVEYADKRISRLNPGAWLIINPEATVLPEARTEPFEITFIDPNTQALLDANGLEVNDVFPPNEEAV